jgi:hypothetical protein
VAARRSGDKVARWWSGVLSGMRYEAHRSGTSGTDGCGRERGGCGHLLLGRTARGNISECHFNDVGFWGGEEGVTSIDGGERRRSSDGVCLRAKAVAGWRLSSMAREATRHIRAAATPTKGGGDCSQWWGAASSEGGRSPGGQVGRLGLAEVAGPSRPGSGEVGCKELWAENDFRLPRENKNVFEICWLQI